MARTENYVAFLRGVSPSNASSAALAAAFERAGFAGVKTVQSSGNVRFSARPQSEAKLEERAEAALEAECGRPFPTIVRSVGYLHQLIARDPWSEIAVPAGAKRVVTFLRRTPASAPQLPVGRDGAHLLALVGREVYSAYVPSPKGPVFMTLIEQVLGNDVTTRTWDTVRRVAR